MKKYGDDATYTDSEKFMNGMVLPGKEYSSRPRPLYNPKPTNRFKSTHRSKSNTNPKTSNNLTYKPQNSSKCSKTDNDGEYSFHPQGVHYIECKNCLTVYDKRISSKCPLCFEAQCSECGKEYNAKKYSSCPYCDFSIIICSKCGKEYIKKEYDSCPYCKSKENMDLPIIGFILLLTIFFIWILLLSV